MMMLAADADGDGGRINVIAIEANVWNVNVAYWAVFYYFEISPK